MGDSDDEYHRRGRDKFTRERNDYADRPRQRDYDFDRLASFRFFCHFCVACTGLQTFLKSL